MDKHLLVGFDLRLSIAAHTSSFAWSAETRAGCLLNPDVTPLSIDPEVWPSWLRPLDVEWLPTIGCQPNHGMMPLVRESDLEVAEAALGNKEHVSRIAVSLRAMSSARAEKGLGFLSEAEMGTWNPVTERADGGKDSVEPNVEISRQRTCGGVQTRERNGQLAG
ncbi:MAG: hypothetical protein U0Q16_08765 [Bryobacteraceae bacterium]